MGDGRAPPPRGLFVATAGALAAAILAACSRSGSVREGLEMAPGLVESTAAADVIDAQGGRILRAIAEARTDIHRDYPLRAEGSIDRADRMLDLIEQSLPTADVRHRIWVARRHLEYAKAQDMTGDLVPICAAIDRVESLAPADSIRRHLRRTERYLDNGDRRAAERELAQADQELLFVEVDLPLSSARHRLAQARGALAMGQADRATAALQQAEDELVFLTGVVRSPLGAARWSLAKAAAVYAGRDTRGAEKYLTLARRSLQRAGDRAPEASRSAIQLLVDELRDLEGRLATPGVDALEELEQLNDRVRALVHPA